MATIKKTPEGTWQVAIRRKGHKPVYKTFPKRALAETWARETEGGMDAGSFQDYRKAEKSLLTDQLDKYEQEITPSKKSQRTERAALAHLRAFFCHLTLASCQPKVVVSYAEGRLQKVSSDTVRRELQILSDVFETCRVGWGIACINPVPEARRTLRKRKLLQPGVRRDRRLYPGELEALVATYHKLESDLCALIEFAVETAMRRSEIFAMRRRDINKQACTLRIPVSKTDHQTGREGRTIPLSPRAMQILASLPLRLDGQVWMYTDVDAISRGFARTVSQARRAYLARCARDGVDPDEKFLVGLRFHDLRHEGTSRLFEKGWSIAEVAAVTGHEDWDSLQRYTHLMAGKLADKLAEGFVAPGAKESA